MCHSGAKDACLACSISKSKSLDPVHRKCCNRLEKPRRSLGAQLREVVHVVAHCHKQVEEQLASFLHLHLQGSAALKSLTTADDKSKVMSAQSGISLGCIVICISSRSQDHVGWKTTLKTLLSESKALELFQAVLLSSTVHCRVSENEISHTEVEHCRLARSTATSLIDILGVLE